MNLRQKERKMIPDRKAEIQRGILKKKMKNTLLNLNKHWLMKL